MAKYTATLTEENDARLVTAVKTKFEREKVNGELETDRQMVDRWLAGLFTMVVYGNERRAAEGNVAPDATIAVIT